MRMRSLLRLLRSTASLWMATAALALPAFAAPVLITQGGFSGSETVVDFNSIGNEVSITNQFSGNGVTWSGPIFGMTSSGDTDLFPSSGGGVIASNWLYSGGNVASTDPMTATFAGPVTRAGFLYENNPDDSLFVTLFLGAANLGSFTIPNPNGVTVDFFGVEDVNGFDRIEINLTGTSNQFLAIDDFRFEGDVNSVPEPATFLLLAVGLVGLHLRRRR